MKFGKWPAESLRQTLIRDYPGCKNLADAIAQARAKLHAQEKEVDKKEAEDKTKEEPKKEDDLAGW